LVVGLIFALSITAICLFFDSPAKATEPPIPADSVVATVGEEPIFAREVQRLQDIVVRGKQLSPVSVRTLQTQLLEEIVNRRLALASAKRTGEAANDKEIEQALANVNSKLTTQHKKLEDFLADQSISEEELQRQLAWNVFWERSLVKYITPQRLQKFFDSHRHEFDGTELSVSHILLKAPPDEKEKGNDELFDRAESLRQDILAGKISFAEAVEKYSVGPSSSDAGKLGFIGRHGPMDNAFSRAAFALELGEISLPVRTPFGIHLIRCDEVRPGKRQLADVESEVRDAMARELLKKLAQAERNRTPVKYSDNFPQRDSEGQR
jgi:parvulin-like peptidyl-prolyl isomerase